MFPSNPTDGQKFFSNGLVFRYKESKQSWEKDRVLDPGEITSLSNTLVVRQNGLPQSVAFTSAVSGVINLRVDLLGSTNPTNPASPSGQAFNSLAAALAWLSSSERRFPAGIRVEITFSDEEHSISSLLNLNIANVSEIVLRGGLNQFSAAIDLSGFVTSGTSSESIRSAIELFIGLGTEACRLTFSGEGRLVIGEEGNPIGGAHLKKVRFENLLITKDLDEDSISADAFVSIAGFAYAEMDTCAIVDLGAKYVVGLSSRSQGVLFNSCVFINTAAATSVGGSVYLIDCCSVSSSRDFINAANCSVGIRRSFLSYCTEAGMRLSNCKLSTSQSLIRNTFGLLLGNSMCSLQSTNIKSSTTGISVFGGSLRMSGGSVDQCTDGGLRLHACTCSLRSTVISNTAYASNPSIGSGIYALTSQVILDSCTFSNNTPRLFHLAGGSSIGFNGSNGATEGNEARPSTTAKGIVTTII